MGKKRGINGNFSIHFQLSRNCILLRHFSFLLQKIQLPLSNLPPSSPQALMFEIGIFHFTFMLSLNPSRNHAAFQVKPYWYQLIYQRLFPRFYFLLTMSNFAYCCCVVKLASILDRSCQSSESIENYSTSLFL